MISCVKKLFYDLFFCQGGVKIKATEKAVWLNVVNQVFENYISWRSYSLRSVHLWHTVKYYCLALCALSTLLDVVILGQLFALIFDLRKQKEQHLMLKALRTYEKSEWLEYISDSFRVALAVLYLLVDKYESKDLLILACAQLVYGSAGLTKTLARYGSLRLQRIFYKPKRNEMDPVCPSVYKTLIILCLLFTYVGAVFFTNLNEGRDSRGCCPLKLECYIPAEGTASCNDEVVECATASQIKCDNRRDYIFIKQKLPWCNIVENGRDTILKPNNSTHWEKCPDRYAEIGYCFTPRNDDPIEKKPWRYECEKKEDDGRCLNENKVNITGGAGYKHRMFCELATPYRQENEVILMLLATVGTLLGISCTSCCFLFKFLPDKRSAFPRTRKLMPASAFPDTDADDLIGDEDSNPPSVILSKPTVALELHGQL